MSVSLSRGHIRSHDFYINFPAQYFIRLDADEQANCSLRDPGSVLKTRLTLSRNGQSFKEVDGEFQHYLVGYFDSIGSFTAEDSGLYRLDIDVLSDASCLNATPPRLMIVTISDSFHELHYAELCLSGILILCGCGLLNRTRVRAFARRWINSEGPAIFGKTGSKFRRPPSRFPLREPFSRLPSFGLLATLPLLLVVVIFLVNYSNFPRPKGIWVSVSPRYFQETEPQSFTNTPLVQLESAGAESLPQLYVNRKPVAWEDLNRALLAELKLRADWVVYVQADSELSWADIARAIDTIHELQARIVLLDPQKRRRARALSSIKRSR